MKIQTVSLKKGEWCVYHIKRPTMGLDEGYIGITQYPERRAKEHSKSKYVVGNAIRKYDDIEMEILLVADEDYCLLMEEKLRPEPELGWNLRIGGHKVRWGAETRKKMSEAKLGTKRSKEACKAVAEGQAKRANVYDAKTDEIIAKDVVLTHWSEENGYLKNGLTRTAAGTRKQYKGMYARYL